MKFKLLSFSKFLLFFALISCFYANAGYDLSGLKRLEKKVSQLPRTAVNLDSAKTKDFEIQINHLENNNKELTDQLDQKVMEISELEGNIKDIETKLNKTRNEVIGLERQIIKLKDDKSILENLFNEAKQAEQKTSREIDKANSRINDLNTRLKEFDRNKQDLKDLKKKQQNLKDVQNQLNTAQAEINKKQYEIEKLNDEINLLKMNQQKFEMEQSESQQEVLQENLKLQDYLAQKEDEIEKMQEQERQLSGQLKEFQQHIDDLEEKLIFAENDKSSFVDKITEEGKKSKKLVQRIEELERDLSDTLGKSRLEEAKFQEEMRDVNETKNYQIEELKKEAVFLSKQLKAKSDKAKQNEEKYEQEIAEKDEEILKFKERVKNLEKRLSKNKQDNKNLRDELEDKILVIREQDKKCTDLQNKIKHKNSIIEEQAFEIDNSINYIEKLMDLLEDVSITNTKKANVLAIIKNELIKHFSNKNGNQNPIDNMTINSVGFRSNPR